MKIKLAFVSGLFVLFSLGVIAQNVPVFQKNERIVFLGNSITDGGRYHSYIWLYYMTHFPDRPIAIYNAGIGGDTAADMYKRLDGDPLSHNPTTMVITFGMNDSGYGDVYDQENSLELRENKFESCVQNSKKIEERLKKSPKLKVIFLGSSPFDETAKLPSKVYTGKNAVMQRISDYQQKRAHELGWKYVDFNRPMTRINETIQKQDTAFSLSGSDRIHPGNDGHMVMAYLFLKAQNLDKYAVAEVEIDTENKRVLQAENCKISQLKQQNNQISFDYLAKSLPYPLDTITRYWSSNNTQGDIDRFVPFSWEMNREILKITGLQGDFKLLIDGVEIGTWSGEQWEEGVNLALETRTPQYRQALSVMHLNEVRYEIEKKFRSYEWIQYYLFEPKGLLYANNEEAINLLNEELKTKKWMQGHAENYIKLHHSDVRQNLIEMMNQTIKKIYTINKPVKRQIKLIKI